MNENINITTLFLDIGNVLLSNGWGRASRALAAQKFTLDMVETEARHNLCFDTYELGKLSLDQYLENVIFYMPRSFTKNEFVAFMYSQTVPMQEMINTVAALKKKYGLKVAIVNNEGRELNAYRIETFGLKGLADFFISSCFVHLRKPDTDIFSLALDIAMVRPGEVVYIDDQAMHINAAKCLGINGIQHTGYEATIQALAGYGLSV